MPDDGPGPRDGGISGTVVVTGVDGNPGVTGGIVVVRGPAVTGPCVTGPCERGTARGVSDGATARGARVGGVAVWVTTAGVTRSFR